MKRWFDMEQRVCAGKRYCLPVQAMVKSMCSSPRLVLLQAHVTDLPGVSRQQCLAHVVVGQGCLHSCTILGLAGSILLQAREAYEALIRCGDLEWVVITAPPLDQPAQAVSGRSPVSSAPAGTPWDVPTLRVRPVPREIFAALPYLSRITLALVDGKRSLAEIAHLLNKTPQEIWQILADLQDVVHL